MSRHRDLLEIFKGIQCLIARHNLSSDDLESKSVRTVFWYTLNDVFERTNWRASLSDNEDCLLLGGNGRDLSFLCDNSIDCIITDHPWSDDISNKGGNRDFASYDTFRYTQKDFNEKARVLKPGAFLCEIIPAENENNFKYLYELKELALKAGFLYYAKISWKKGNFVANTGRKAKNTEDIMIFSKGPARALRYNGKKYTTGTNGMLPTCFEIPETIDVQAVSNSRRILQSEKPVELFEQLLDYLTLEGEIVLDQFAGSGSLGKACIRKNRKCLLIEKSYRQEEHIINRLNLLTIHAALL